MKHLRLLTLSLVMSCLLMPFGVSAAVDATTEASLYSGLRGIEHFVNRKDIDALLMGLSNSSREGLAEELRNSFPEGTVMLLHTDWTFTDLPNGHYWADTRVDFQVDQSEKRWKTTGFQVTYEFESTEQDWVIVDTNLGELISGSEVKRMQVVVSMLVVLASALAVATIVLWQRQKKEDPAASQNP